MFEYCIRLFGFILSYRFSKRGTKKKRLGSHTLPQLRKPCVLSRPKGDSALCEGELINKEGLMSYCTRAVWSFEVTASRIPM